MAQSHLDDLADFLTARFFRKVMKIAKVWD